MGTAIISHSDSAPVFEPAEHYLYFVPLFIELFVIRNRFFSVSFARNARGDAFVAEPVGIISPVREKFIGFWQAVE